MYIGNHLKHGLVGHLKVCQISVLFLFSASKLDCALCQSGWPHKSQNKIPGVFQVRTEQFQVLIDVTCNPYLISEYHNV